MRYLVGACLVGGLMAVSWGMGLLVADVVFDGLEIRGATAYVMSSVILSAVESVGFLGWRSLMVSARSSRGCLAAPAAVVGLPIAGIAMADLVLDAVDASGPAAWIAAPLVASAASAAAQSIAGRVVPATTIGVPLTKAQLAPVETNRAGLAAGSRLRSLRECGDTDGLIREIHGLLEHGVPRLAVRDLVDALTSLGDEGPHGAVARLLGDPDEDVRLGVAIALAERATARHVPSLVGALGDPAPSVRLMAVEALRRVPAPEAIPAVRALLADDDPDVALAAAEALAGTVDAPWDEIGSAADKDKESLWGRRARSRRRRWQAVIAKRPR